MATTVQLATPRPTWSHDTEVVIVGSGAAGLSAAVRLADAGVPAVVLTRAADPIETATDWAQGGLAAVWDPSDSTDAHLADTLTAGAGLCRPSAVRTLVDAAPGAVRDLIDLGATFDRDPEGTDYDLHLEGGHGARRILHARGDGSGREVQRTLLTALRERLARTGCSVRMATSLRAVDVLTDAAGAACGVRARAASGSIGDLRARAVVLATGGIGRAWSLSSNPVGATGDGPAMAWRAGAVLEDMEFVQFHPTVLHRPPGQPRTGGRDVLISEAVRGEGAVLIDGRGRRVMVGAHPLADLAPRDVVAATMHTHLQEHGGECLFLDARHFGARGWARRFPGILAMLRTRGVDPVTTPIPVRPGAHYLCGGVAADMSGATTVPGLFVVGESAATGVQGANRLASNSVTEALVMGRGCGDRLIADTLQRPGPVQERRPVAVADPAGLVRLHRAMDAHVGVSRTAAGLQAALAELDALPTLPTPALDDAVLDMAALHTVGRLVAHAALARRESRGAHRRADHPGPDTGWELRLGLSVGPAGGIDVSSRPLETALTVG